MTQPTPETVGPFKAIGLLLGIIAPVAQALHETAHTGNDIVMGTRRQVNNGFKAIDTIVDNALLDFATDNIVADAKRTIRIAEAKAEAKVIIATLKAVTPNTVNQDTTGGN